MNRIQKLFPGELADEFEQNSLIERIRVPRNILYLSDRLPKPRYNDEAKKRKTGYLGENSLPIIPSKSTTKKQKPHLEAILSSKELARQYKIPKKVMLSAVENDAILEAENEPNNDPISPLKNPIVPIRIKKQPRQLKKIPMKSAIIADEPVPQKETTETDDYIKQLVGKKNPIVKYGGMNVDRLAEIYSGGNAQQIIAMQKNKIDKILEVNRRNRLYGRIPKPLAKASYDVSPYLESALKGGKHRPMPYSIAGLQIRGKLSIPSPLKGNLKAAIDYKKVIRQPNEEAT